MHPLLEFCGDVPVRTFEPGAVLLNEGETSGLLYILVDGEVEIVKGDFQINVVADPGAIFGELSVLLDIPHMASVRALTSCRAHEVRDANGFLQANPGISYHLAQLLARRLHGVSTYLVDLKHQLPSMTIIWRWSMMYWKPWCTSRLGALHRGLTAIPAIDVEPFRQLPQYRQRALQGLIEVDRLRAGQ